MNRHAWVHEAAIKDKRMGDATFRVYSFLLTYIRNGRGFPKARTIALEMGRARSTVSGHLNEAARLGYLIIEPNYRRDGGQAHNIYRVPDVALVNAPSVDATDKDAADCTPVDIPDTPPVGPGPTPIKNKAIEQGSPSGTRAHAREGRSAQSSLLLPLNCAIDSPGRRCASAARPPPASEPRRGGARRGRATDLLGTPARVVIEGEWEKWSG
jgi:hypothetical protein